MMQTPVRYYITKDHDQPVVRTVPVAVSRLERSVAIEATSRPTEISSTSSARQGAPEPRRVTRFVRAAVRRTTLDAAD